jgi:hypothetical protein
MTPTMPDSPPQDDAPPPRGRFQFGLGSLLLAMALVSVASAGLAGLLRQTVAGVLFAVAAPTVLVAVLGAIHWVVGYVRRPR